MKKLFLMALIVIFTVLNTFTAFAADGNVIYDGYAKAFIFEPGSDESPTDLFPNFKGVMPGDTLTQKITVKNDASDEVKVKIYLRSLGAHDDSADFLSKLSLKVKKSEDNDMAYMFDTNADETTDLSDWVWLGTLYSGGTVNLDVELNVPVELDNEFQNQTGFIDWEFMVQEFPVEDTDRIPPPTSDNFNFKSWIVVTCSSLILIVILLVLRKKGKENT